MLLERRSSVVPLLKSLDSLVVHLGSALEGAIVERETMNRESLREVDRFFDSSPGLRSLDDLANKNGLG